MHLVAGIALPGLSPTALPLVLLVAQTLTHTLVLDPEPSFLSQVGGLG